MPLLMHHREYEKAELDEAWMLLQKRGFHKALLRLRHCFLPMEIPRVRSDDLRFQARNPSKQTRLFDLSFQISCIRKAATLSFGGNGSVR